MIYFFAVFTVHYVGEMFRDDVVTFDLSSNMGEAMFTLSDAWFGESLGSAPNRLLSALGQSTHHDWPRFSFATLEDYTTIVRHFMRSGLPGVLAAVCNSAELRQTGSTDLN